MADCPQDSQRMRDINREIGLENLLRGARIGVAIGKEKSGSSFGDEKRGIQEIEMKG